MTADEVLRWISTASNFAAIGIGIRIIQKFTVLEFKINMMWGVFSRRFGTRQESGEQE